MNKSKVMCIERNEEPSPLNITINGEIMEVVNTFKYLGSFFSRGGGVKEDMSMRIGEGIKTFGAVKSTWRCRSVTLNEKKELYKRIVVPTVMYGYET